MCDFPFFKKGESTPLPCGRCPACLKRRTDSWIFRLLQEDKVRSGAIFVTLTYDTAHVPLTESGYMTLCKRDLQLFFKRYRKAHYEKFGRQHRISYYAVGEYGSSTLRPHYHAIIFDGDRDLLQGSWTSGDVHVGDCTGASVAYTCKYINKGKVIPVHRFDDRLREFSVMSKRLGISYISPKTIKFHHDDLSRNYVTLDGGVKSALPRYFRDKIYSREQKEAQEEILEKSVRARDRSKYEAYIKRTGSADGFIASVNEARRASVDNFRRRQLRRNKI